VLLISSGPVADVGNSALSWSKVMKLFPYPISIAARMISGDFMSSLRLIDPPLMGNASDRLFCQAGTN
jgi:hypothetical protein